MSPEGFGRWGVRPSDLRSVVAAIVGAALGLTSQSAVPQLQGQTAVTDPPGVHVERVAPSMIYVSVSRQDLTLERLIGQARHIVAAYASNWTGRIGFFTSRQAARTFTMNLLVDLPPDLTESSRHFLAMYEVENEKEYLTVFPFGFFADFKHVRVPVDGSQVPPCGFQLAARCLLRLDTIGAPASTPNGTVTLQARATRQGKLERLRLIETQSDQPKQRDHLVRAALENAKTWWLESSRTEQDVRITYVFGDRRQIANVGGFELMLEASNHVTLFATVSNIQTSR